MAITLSEHAAKKIQSHLAKSHPQLGMRLGVKQVGCSGFAYTFDYVDEIRAGDHVFESLGVTLVVDAASLPFLDGSHLDFVKQGFNETFKFDNPNAASECGCGESFNLKKPGVTP
jgi:iron-sulfur cluster assembly protein